MNEPTSITMKPLNPISERQKQRLAKYIVIRDAWRAKPENHYCCFPNCKRPASIHPHHVRGRIGELLFDVRGFKPLCDYHHDWVHCNIESARNLGLICEKGFWGKPFGLSGDTARPNEIPIGWWWTREAVRLGISVSAFIRRYYSGKVPQPKTRRVNKRVVFVEVENV